MIIRKATEDDVPNMMEIYNDAVRHLTATFDIQVKSLEDRLQWFRSFRDQNPLLVAEMDGKVVGYCGLSPFREKEAYKYTMEVSLYIDRTYRGKGIGKSLLQEMIEIAKVLQIHCLIAGITTGNEASVKLHERFGFEFIGRFKEVGFKFNEWQHVDFYQLLL